MDMKHSRLFSPLQIGSLTLSNRVGMAPMSMDYEAADGTVPKSWRTYLSAAPREAQATS